MLRVRPIHKGALGGILLAVFVLWALRLLPRLILLLLIAWAIGSLSQ
jgi:hypothetical protein